MELKKCFIFDFDFTLAKTECKITVTHKDGSITKLNPAEFNTYKYQDGDAFDYTEFDQIIGPQELPLMVLARQLCVEGHTVFVLTARGIEAKNPIIRYLRSQGVHLHEICCIGSSSSSSSEKIDVAAKKREWLLTIAESYDKIFFYDDCQEIIDAASTVDKTKVYKI
jgi:hypothetical protein